MKSLLLALLVVGSLRAQASDPTTQLLNTLNTASLQLQALGTLTLNNNTFVQLVQVLNSVFGSMQTSVLPFYYSQMQSINSLHNNLANRLLQVEATTNSVYNALAGYVDNMLDNYAGQLATIGGTLFSVQDSTLASLDQLEATLGQFSGSFSGLAANLTSMDQDARNASQGAAAFVAQTNVLLQQAPVLLNPHNKSMANIDLASVTLGSTALAYCKSFVYNFPNTYGNSPGNPATPNVGLNINLSGHEATANTGYDLVLANTSPSAATVWVCDRSLASFTLSPATLLITVWL